MKRTEISVRDGLLYNQWREGIKSLLQRSIDTYPWHLIVNSPTGLIMNETRQYVWYDPPTTRRLP